MPRKGKFIEIENRPLAPWSFRNCLELEVGEVGTTNGIFWGDGEVLNWIVVMAAWLCMFTKNHCILHE